MSITPRSSIEWMRRAKCQHMNPIAFDYHEKLAGSTPSDAVHAAYAAAAELCNGCPVMRECARDALDQQDVEVVRGGVPIPSRGRRRDTQRARLALAHIAAGEDSQWVADYVLPLPEKTLAGVRL